MGKFKSHPALLVAVGVVIGLVFSSQLSKVPGVSKLPKV
jgi:hypothetical protein